MSIKSESSIKKNKYEQYLFNKTSQRKNSNLLLVTTNS